MASIVNANNSYQNGLAAVTAQNKQINGIVTSLNGNSASFTSFST
jgi:hypothetical protein